MILSRPRVRSQCVRRSPDFSELPAFCVIGAPLDFKIVAASIRRRLSPKATSRTGFGTPIICLPKPLLPNVASGWPGASPAVA